MAIVKPDEMNFSGKNLAFILSGLPGTGKTTLGLSAPDPLLIDADNGVSRVNIKHRKDTSVCTTFDEVKADVEAAKGKYKTIVIDTGGALVEMMKDFVVSHPQDFKGGAKATGGISQQGYGHVKMLWNDFSRDLRNNFNVVFIFHESVSKNGEDGKLLYELVVEGSTRTTVYQSADLAAHLFINDKQRYLGFTPTESYSAKACYGISGLMPVPELKEGDPNNFLEKLFNKVRENLEKEAGELDPKKKQYAEIMASVREFVNNIGKPEDVIPALKVIRGLPSVLTSAKEAEAAVKARIKELNIVYDKESRSYV